jgi:polysaccharide deacetylase 2 family uncharacterized protein YibQ
MAVALYLQWRDHFPASPGPAIPEAIVQPVRHSRQLADTLYASASTVLEEVGIWKELVVRNRQGLDHIEVRVPGDLPLPEVNLHLARFVQERGGRVHSAVEKEGGLKVEMRCGFDSLVTTLFTLVQAPEIRRRAGRIAIVLDQLGSRNGIARRFCALPQPLTLSLLPGQDRSIVELAQGQGHEMLVTLSLEPDSEGHAQTSGPEAIHSEEELRQQVRQAIRHVPGAVGLSHFPDGPAASHSQWLHPVLLEAKAHDLIFMVGHSPQTQALARQMGIKAFSGDLLIDAIDHQQAVEGRLWELAALAARTGQAIGVGHGRETTLLALEAVLPRLEARGFRFAPLSALGQ